MGTAQRIIRSTELVVEEMKVNSQSRRPTTNVGASGRRTNVSQQRKFAFIRDKGGWWGSELSAVRQ